MGPIFGILLWAVILGLLIALTLISAVILFFGWKRKSLLLKLLGGIPLSLCLLVIGSFGILFAWGLYDSFTPSRVFEIEFGFAAPPEVTELRGYAWVFFDSGKALLRFKAPPDIVRRIVSQRLQEATAEDAAPYSAGTPDWWGPSTGPNVKVYISEQWTESFATSRAALYYDPDTRIVHFIWQGID